MIYLGADHGGFELKEKIKKWLSEWGYQWEDLGNKVLDINDDYPEFAFRVAKKVAEDEVKNQKSKIKSTSQNLKEDWKDKSKGILACRSAAGMVIAANKIKGIRAAAAFDEKSAIHSRINNDANILAVSGDWMDDDAARKVIKVWLETEFSEEERHRRRLAEIGNFEATGSVNSGGV